MNNFLPIVVLALVCAVSLASASSSSLQNEPSLRQARSVSQTSQANMIDQNGPVGKSKIEIERKQVQEFLSARNLLKSVMKLIFGSQDEINATSRHVVSILGKVLDLLKSSFGHRSRSAGGRGSVRDWAEEGATAGLTMLQGYVKSVLANDEQCVQKHLCQASKEATQNNRELGYLIASVGGYATSYLLDTNKSTSIGFKALHDAALKGRSSKDIEECAKAFKCTENESL